MCAPLYDDKGTVRYFIGAQIDVTGLVIEGLGVESFRALLHKDGMNDLERKSELDHQVNPNKKKWHDEKVKETHAKLRELSMMFSQDEADVVSRNIRGGDDTSDSGGSIKSGVPTSVRNRGKSKRIIGETGDPLHAFSNLTISNGHQMNYNLPGVYRYVS